MELLRNITYEKFMHIKIMLFHELTLDYGFVVKRLASQAPTKGSNSQTLAKSVVDAAARVNTAIYSYRILLSTQRRGAFVSILILQR